MSPVAYTVTAILPDEATRSAYLTWLQDGHVDAVISAGAHVATIVSVNDPADPPTVHVRYIFSTRATLDHYLEHHAPKLRAEGLHRFGPQTGVRFVREIGSVV